MSVLVAEDDRIARRRLEATLSKWGYDVIAVSNDALYRARESGRDRVEMALAVEATLFSDTGCRRCAVSLARPPAACARTHR